tara:strand:- start:2692 stop:3057 length:366 start_codon:yes stop_codon:yes gene_type:complete
MITESIAFKENASFKPSNFRPEMVALLTALLVTAPDTTDGRMVITEGHRPAQHTDDAHTWCNAFDIRSQNVEAADDDARELAMWEWVGRVRQRLDDPLGSYQFVVHGEGFSMHIHAEIDPR